MEKHYETVCILRPDLGEDVVKGVIQKATDTLGAGKGRLNKVDEWGRRRLSFPIQKKNDGYYFVLDYNCAPEVSKEIERLFKINEDVLRYQTINLDKEPKPAPPKPPKKKAAEKEAKGGEEHGKA